MRASGDTICAIASPPGGGERGVVRVSGPRAAEIVLKTWTGGEDLRLEAGRGVFRGRFDDGGGVQPLLLLWMPGPRSFTREDVAEFHLPGAPPLLARALSRLVELGARLAEPGEFTRRAFESGRIDLTRAEGVLSLVEARSEAARRSAIARAMSGDTPTGSPAGVAPVTRSGFDILMAARRIPPGASSETTSWDMFDAPVISMG